MSDYIVMGPFFAALLILIYPGIMIRHFRRPRNIIETVPGNFLK